MAYPEFGKSVSSLQGPKKKAATNSHAPDYACAKQNVGADALVLLRLGLNKGVVLMSEIKTERNQMKKELLTIGFALVAPLAFAQIHQRPPRPRRRKAVGRSLPTRLATPSSLRRQPGRRLTASARRSLMSLEAAGCSTKMQSGRGSKSVSQSESTMWAKATK